MKDARNRREPTSRQMEDRKVKLDLTRILLGCAKKAPHAHPRGQLGSGLEWELESSKQRVFTALCEQPLGRGPLTKVLG